MKQYSNALFDFIANILRATSRNGDWPAYLMEHFRDRVASIIDFVTNLVG